MVKETDQIIGRVLATEKVPTTIDNFAFWTNSDFILNPFDIVKVSHLDGSFTYGVIENISHITDAASFLTNYISSDFGNTAIDEPTIRVGMNYVQASIRRTIPVALIYISSFSFCIAVILCFIGQIIHRRKSKKTSARFSSRNYSLFQMRPLCENFEQWVFYGTAPVLL